MYTIYLYTAFILFIYIIICLCMRLRTLLCWRMYVRVLRSRTCSETRPGRHACRVLCPWQAAPWYAWEAWSSLCTQPSACPTDGHWWWYVVSCCIGLLLWHTQQPRVSFVLNPHLLYSGVHLISPSVTLEILYSLLRRLYDWDCSLVLFWYSTWTKLLQS